MTMRPLLSVLFLVLTLSGSQVWGQETVRSLHGQSIDGVKLLDEAWELTRKNFYRQSVLTERGWNEIRGRYRERAKAALSSAEMRQIISEMLAELKTSHLAIVDPRIYQRHLANEFSNTRVPQLGLELVEIAPRELYIGGLLEGSAADLAGLRAGDRVLEVNGLPAIDAEALCEAGHDPGLPGHPSYVLIVEDKEEVVLQIQRKAKAEPFNVTVTATRTNMIEAIQNSIRVIEQDGKKIGVIHLWHFMSSDVSRITERALRDKFKDCDGLILDIRGRGGSTAVVSQLLGMFYGRRAIWNRPTVVLTHDHTRSAKEIFSLRWRQAKRGPVVGETTQGACIGTVFKPLSDGSYMLLPLTDVRSITGGIEIEGRGVDPDIFVKELPLPYRAGQDRIMLGGIKVLLEELRKAAPQAKPRSTRRLYQLIKPVIAGPRLLVGASH